MLDMKTPLKNRATP